MRDIPVRVIEMKFEKERDYATEGFPETEVVKVLFHSDGVSSPFHSLVILSTLPTNAINPFVLGQRLVLSLDHPTSRTVEALPPVPLHLVDTSAERPVHGLGAVEDDRDIESGPSAQGDGHPGDDLSDESCYTTTSLQAGPALVGTGV